jgi:hypothetical protein
LINDLDMDATATSTLTYSKVWSIWSRRLGKVFWPSLGISAIGTFLTGLVGMFGLLQPIEQEWLDASTRNALPHFSFTWAMGLGILAVFLAIMTFTMWSMSSLLLYFDTKRTFTDALRQAFWRLPKTLVTALGVAVTGALPVIAASFALAASSGLTSSSNQNLRSAVGAMAVVWIFGVIWITIVAIISAFAIYLTITENMNLRDSIRTSWKLAIPIWWKIIVYPLPIIGISIVGAILIGWLPIIGQPIVSVISNTLLYTFLFTLFRQRRPAPESLLVDSPKEIAVTPTSAV